MVHLHPTIHTALAAERIRDAQHLADAHRRAVSPPRPERQSRAASPSRARAITRRWISDVPS
jgi:hypothetical protein